jgi:hypothetical protein
MIFYSGTTLEPTGTRPSLGLELISMGIWAQSFCLTCGFFLGFYGFFNLLNLSLCLTKKIYFKNYYQ